MLGSADLSGFLYKFIRTQDCFLRTLPDPCLSIDLRSFEYSDSVLTVVCFVLWQAPSVEFENIQETVRPLAKYSFSPRYMGPSFEVKRSSVEPLVEEVMYTVPLPLCSLDWDVEGRYFWAVCPNVVSQILPPLLYESRTSTTSSGHQKFSLIIMQGGRTSGFH